MQLRFLWLHFLFIKEYNIPSAFRGMNGGETMPKTVVRENETLDDALRRFKRQVNKAGTIQECRRRESFLKKGLKRKLKSENARRKNRK